MLISKFYFSPFLGEKKLIKPPHLAQNLKKSTSKHIKHEASTHFHQTNTSSKYQPGHNTQTHEPTAWLAQAQQHKLPSAEWGDDWSDSEFPDNNVKTEAKHAAGLNNSVTASSCDWSDDDDIDFPAGGRSNMNLTPKTIKNKAELGGKASGGFEEWSDNDDMDDFVPASPSPGKRETTQAVSASHTDHTTTSRDRRTPSTSSYAEPAPLAETPTSAANDEMNWSDDDFEAGLGQHSSQSISNTKHQNLQNLSSTKPASSQSVKRPRDETSNQNAHVQQVPSSINQGANALHVRRSINQTATAQQGQKSIHSFFQKRNLGSSAQSASQTASRHTVRAAANSSIVDLISSDEEDFNIPVSKPKTKSVTQNDSSSASTVDTESTTGLATKPSTGECADFHRSEFHYLGDVMAGRIPESRRLIVKVR